ncbi:hypothetical protein CEXT_506091 [Caerostris extrusa]|uniref:Uncharacterized protein n=1 Tax=Caerostris extrusa TaxID=172846 RepID=A0AAV4XFZ6_CAEEX|nr:hypothetical protein CEXT_506091 [Caerostris extrusa]
MSGTPQNLRHENSEQEEILIIMLLPIPNLTYHLPKGFVTSHFIIISQMHVVLIDPYRLLTYIMDPFNHWMAMTGKCSWNESAAYVLKLTSEEHMKDYEEPKTDPINGVSKIGISNAFKYKPQPKVLDLQDSSSSSEYSVINSVRAPEMTRHDSSNICITGLRHKILPDPPKLIYGKALCAPSPTPPRSTPPLPPPPINSTVSELSHTVTNGAGAHKQPYMRRMSPVPTSSWQALNYTSSASSTPQRGTSPITSNRSPMVVVNNSQIHHQLAHQLQNLTVNSNGSTVSSGRSDGPYHAGGSQNGKSWYSSSPQPSYASSSSGRHSPTPTISSSEYSIPPVFKLKRTPPPAYTPPSSYSSSPQPSPQHRAPSPGGGVASSVTSVLSRPAALQAWSSRQAKSQSPIIMQSVKSTQVQKPVLQTAVAPTSPPPSCTVSSGFATSCQQPPSTNPPPPYPIHKVTSAVSINSTVPSQDANSLFSSNCVSSAVRTIESSIPPPLYPRNQNKSHVSTMNHVADPPYYPVVSSVTQPSIPPSPTPPPYNNPMWQVLSCSSQNITNQPPPYLAANQASELEPPVTESLQPLYSPLENQQDKWSEQCGNLSPEVSPVDNCPPFQCSHN